MATSCGSPGLVTEQDGSKLSEIVLSYASLLLALSLLDLGHSGVYVFQD